jgi:recombinational DNA repair protein RecR
MRYSERRLGILLIPVGSDLEFADEMTMSKALEHRHEL